MLSLFEQYVKSQTCVEQKSNKKVTEPRSAIAHDTYDAHFATESMIQYQFDELKVLTFMIHPNQQQNDVK